MLLEDKRGGIWIGTTSGLNHYKNGIFTVYTEKEGLNNRFIISLFEDSKDNLWVGTKDGLSSS